MHDVWRYLKHFSLLALALVIGAGVFGGAGVWMMAMGFPALRSGIRSLEYREVQGEMTSVSISRSEAEFVYRYTVEGRDYENTRFSWEATGLESDQSPPAVRFARRHNAGEPVTVYFDRADPAISVLEPGVPVGGAIMVGMAMPFITVGASVLILVIGNLIAGIDRFGGHILENSNRRIVFRRGRIGYFIMGAAFLVALPLGLFWCMYSWIVGPPATLWPVVLLVSIVVLTGTLAAACGFILIRRGEYDLIIDHERGVLIPPRGLGSGESFLGGGLPPPASIPISSIQRVDAIDVEKQLPKWMQMIDRGEGPFPTVAEYLQLRLPSTPVSHSPRTREREHKGHFVAVAVTVLCLMKPANARDRPSFSGFTMSVGMPRPLPTGSERI